MGSGLSGGPLTGSPPTGSNIAPAGQSAILAGPLGVGATDVVTKAGSTAADAAVNAAAELLSIRTGIGATEVDRAAFLKGSAADGFTLSAPGTTGALLINGSVGTRLAFGSNTVSLNGTVTNIGNGIATFNASTGAFGVFGTDSTGTPGAATINKPSGKSSIALGAASVTITNSLCAATSRVMFSPHARDATCVNLIVVPGAGSFTVSGAAAATADLPFSWEVSTII